MQTNHHTNVCIILTLRAADIKDQQSKGPNVSFNIKITTSRIKSFWRVHVIRSLRILLGVIFLLCHAAQTKIPNLDSKRRNHVTVLSRLSAQGALRKYYIDTKSIKPCPLTTASHSFTFAVIVLELVCFNNIFLTARSR